MVRAGWKPLANTTEKICGIDGGSACCSGSLSTVVSRDVPSTVQPNLASSKGLSSAGEAQRSAMRSFVCSREPVETL